MATRAERLLSLDVAETMARIPSGRCLALNVLRALLVLALTVWLWGWTPLEKHCGLWMARGAAVTAAWVVPPKRVEILQPDKDNPGVMKPVVVTAKLQTEDFRLASSFYFNLFVPLIVLLLFPLGSWHRALARLVVATVLVAVANIGQTVFELYCRFSARVASAVAPPEVPELVQAAADERTAVILSNCYYIAPLSAVVLAYALVSYGPGLVGAVRWPTFARGRGGPKARKRPAVSRNAPCPCGSGLKHKRCCGK